MAHAADVDTVLRKATLEQRRQSWRETYEMWGKTHGLDIEQYIRREEELAKTRHSVDGSVTWVLVPKDDPETLDRMLSHCETLRRPALMSHPPTRVRCELDEGVRATHVMSVASVFTPERYRRKGYARRMLTLLKEEMHRDSGVSFSTLFSDVGRTYYARLGWRVYPSRELSLTVSKACRDLVENFEDISRRGVGPQLLAPCHLPEVAEQDCAQLASEMAVRFLEPTPAARPAVAVLPTADLYGWFITRMRAHGVQDDVPVGVRFISGGGDAVPASVSFAAWYIDLHAKKMTFLRLRHADSESLAVVLCAALDVASRLGLDSIVCWCPPENVVLQRFCESFVSRAGDLADVADRDRSLPSLMAWETATSTDAEGLQDLDWLYCEGFGWV